MVFPEYLGNFSDIFVSTESYAALIFCTFAFVLWDVGTERTRNELRKWMRDRQLRFEHEQKKKEAKDPTIIRR